MLGIFVGMQLKQYLSETNLSDEAFAEQVKASVHGVIKWKLGVRIPRPDMVARIEGVTNGLVTFRDFLAARQEHLAKQEAANG